VAAGARPHITFSYNHISYMIHYQFLFYKGTAKSCRALTGMYQSA
jgi:hypothetical protein